MLKTYLIIHFDGVRDVEIFDLLLQQSRLQMVKGSGLNPADESVAVQKDFNCNGFNSFC